jgi:pilus assembly protein CpaE
MKPNVSIVLLESDDSARNDIAGALTLCDCDVGIIATTTDFQEAIRIIQADNPQIVILEVNEVEQGLKETAFIVSHFPQITEIVTATEKNPDWILRLIRAGASEYLIKPIAAAELVDAVNKICRLSEQRREPFSDKSSVISVYNPSGGIGTTTIAVNLAAALATQGKNVVLADMNLFNGDVTTFLDLAPRYTLTSVLTEMGQVDASFLRSVIVSHSSGIHVLSGPASLGEADKITPELLLEVIAVLRALFAYTIIDTGGQLSRCNLATFNSSDRILFTTLLNLPALNNAKRYLAAIGKEGIDPKRVKLLINRYIPKDEIKIGDAEKILGTTAYLTVPNAYLDVKTSINKGVPLIMCSPRSPVTKAMNDLASILVS